MSNSTVLSAAVGDKVAGKPAPNKPEDVQKVQNLLSKVLGASAPTMKAGVCDPATLTAIKDFQSAWERLADGRIDPQGQTLRRLDRLAQPLMLQPITLCSVLQTVQAGKMIGDGGAYRIAVRTSDHGPLPPPSSRYTLHVTIQGDRNCFEVTGRPLNDLMSQENLADLLALFDRLNAWAVAVNCRVQLRYKGSPVNTSAPQVLTTPVQPHNGKLVPLDRQSNGPGLTYQGDPDKKDFHGRMFAQVRGYPKHLFVYAGRLETSNQFRGFDCITYAGTACGASNSHMADAEDLADSLGAAECNMQRKVKDPRTGKEGVTTVNLESADPADVKQFFSANGKGSFLMWSSGHVVLVVDGVVHEFKASAPSGYAMTAVGRWLEPYKTKKLTVRRLAGQPARAS